MRGLALETETEDREEAEYEAAEDHGLVVLEIPHSQHRHQEGREDLTDPVLVQQTNCGEAEQDEDLDKKHKLGELPGDGEEEAGAVDGGQEGPLFPAGRSVGLHCEVLPSPARL